MRRRPPPRPTANTRTRTRVPLLAGLIAGLALTAGCGAEPKPPPTPPPVVAAAPSEFGGTDLAWVEIMIPLDEQLLPVLDLVRTKAADQQLVALAGELHGVYDQELPRLRTLSDQAGLPKDNPHKGHKMPGLVDADRLATLRAGTGPEFERQAVATLREHLDQLKNLATSELANGISPTVKTIAQSVAQTRGDASARLPK
ncbi:DUF305 domain-containing protein [Dactylosporangium sp. NPDC049140]|uniref:DUF305 domain-containing protein n=1 Tax=Dactylosporangium sp. NPDC049140 TaxID=3155647 RepID=UPI003404EC66